jgi:type IV secretory pathway VirB2 component (pilin)
MSKGWTQWERARIVGVALVVGLLLPLAAHAQELVPLNNTADWLVGLLKSKAARGFAIVVFAATVGALSVGAIAPRGLGRVIIGIVGIFGAAAIIDTLIQVVQ